MFERLRAAGADDWERRLSAADVPAARVRDFGETMQEAQVEARRLMTVYRLPSVDRVVSAPTLGFKANGERQQATKPPPTLGEDTDAVLADLGKSPAAIAALRDDGIVA